MRLVYLFAPGLVTVHAGLDKMQKIMDVLTKNNTEITQIQKQVVTTAPDSDSSGDFGSGDDGIDMASYGMNGLIEGRSSMMQQLIEIMDLDRYGCWCYFDKDHGKGHGQPVDEFDTYCQHLHQGYDCAMMDARTAGEPECIAWETEYSIENIYTRMNIYSECQVQNKGNLCAINACTVELNFIFFLFEKYFKNSYPALDYRHSLGFDPQATCHSKESKLRTLEDAEFGVSGKKKGSRGDVIDDDEIEERMVREKPVMECCGEYPYRHPYKPEEGLKGCCGDKTYSTRLLTCCAPNILRAVCE
jgi:hypothetical protein